MTEKIAQKPNWLFLTGAVLVVFWSAVIGFLHIGVLYLFGLPILGLILGIILVWFAKENISKKLLVTIVPIPLITAIFFLSIYLNKAESETFLIPTDYRGDIVIFYDEGCGQEPLIVKGRRIYQISNDGVLITKFKKNSGYLDQEFYLVDENENRTEIPKFGRQNFHTEKKVWGDFLSTPVEEFTKETVGAFHSYGAETYFFSPKSFGFIISDYRYFDRDSKDISLERKQFTETAVKLLKECREAK